LAALLPAFQDTNADTAITPATYRSTWDSAVQARAALLSRISIVSSQRASGMPLSGNLLSNTEFSGKSTVGWAHGGAATVSFGTESQRDASQPYAPLGSDAIFMQQIGIIPGGDMVAARDLIPEITPVTPNVRYEFSGYVAAHRCNVQVYLEFFTSSMVAMVPAPQWAGSVLTGGQQLDQWTRATVFGVAPAGAAYCRPLIRKLNTVAGQPDSYCWLLWPYLGIAGADQTVPSEYSPGVPSSHQQLGPVKTADLGISSVTTNVIEPHAISVPVVFLSSVSSASDASRNMGLINIVLPGNGPYFSMGAVVDVSVMLDFDVSFAGSFGEVGIDIKRSYPNYAIGSTIVFDGKPIWYPLADQMNYRYPLDKSRPVIYSEKISIACSFEVINNGDGNVYIEASAFNFGSGFNFSNCRLRVSMRQSLR
jgi:hypothetical protein